MRVAECVSAGLVALAFSFAGCHDSVTTCAGLERVAETVPDTATIRVGASVAVLAGQSYGFCVGEPEHPPPRQYLWLISDSSVVSVSPIDSIQARITGLRVGRAVVTPRYVIGGDMIAAATITVVP